MHILCDSCSILMLIRIAPDMFIDKRYQCCTISHVRAEIYKNQRFKTKYPWLTHIRDKIRCLPNSDAVNNNSVNQYFNVINVLIGNGTINKKKDVEFDLSPVDRLVLACTLGNGYKITTVDDDIKDFAEQEFGNAFKGNISPLAMLNSWIRKRLLNWNDTLYDYVADWKRNNEHPQPKRQKSEFRKLTGYRYPAS